LTSNENSLGKLISSSDPRPWVEADNIPWDEPEFSRRILAEHLSQDHDQASRRLETLERHVDWIHSHLLAGRATRILDLGCGPGLYAERLAILGHRVHGIDFGPASIEYAKNKAETLDLDCDYVPGDLRTTDYGSGYGLAMQVYGELNVFRPADLSLILDKAVAAVEPGGYVLFELTDPELLIELGTKEDTWYKSTGGVFADGPHLVLTERFYDEAARVTTLRYIVIDARTGEPSVYGQSLAVIHPAQIGALLLERGLGEFTVYDGLGGPAVHHDAELNHEQYAVSARKPSG